MDSEKIIGAYNKDEDVKTPLGLCKIFLQPMQPPINEGLTKA